MPSCPLCAKTLPKEALEAHLRYELSLPLAKCARCAQAFVDERSAQRHYRGPFAKHPGLTPALIQTPTEPEAMARLAKVIRMSKSGESSEISPATKTHTEQSTQTSQPTEQRTCVCGHCPVFCTEGIRPSSALSSAPAIQSPLPASQARTLDDSVTDSSQSPRENVDDANESEVRETDLVEDTIVEASDSSDVHDAVEEDPKADNLYEPEASQGWVQGNFLDVTGVSASTNDAAQSFREEPSRQSQSSDIFNDSIISETKSSEPNATKKYPCSLCSSEVGRSSFANHVRFNHIKEKAFLCLLFLDGVKCNRRFRTRDLVRSHQEHRHKAALREDTYSVAQRKESVADWVKRCFGDAAKIAPAGARCRACDKTVRQQDIRDHIAKHHLKKLLYKCRLCGAQSCHSFGMSYHLKSRHGARSTRDTVDDSDRRHYLPAIKAMAEDLFGL